MFCLVIFNTDDEMRVVKESDVKNFDAKLINKKFFRVKFDNKAFYLGRILAVSESEEELLKQMAGEGTKRTKKAPMKCYQNSTTTAEEDSGDEPPLKKQRESNDLERKMAISKKKRIAARGESATAAASTALDEMKRERDYAVASKNSLEASVRALEASVRALMASVKSLEARGEERFLELKELLQKQSDAPALQVPPPPPPPPAPNSYPALFVTQMHNGKEQIHIGAATWVDSECYREACSSTAMARPSLFVREMALVIWGTDRLQKSSVMGRKNPQIRGESTPKMSLEANKIAALQGLFLTWLQGRNFDQHTIDMNINKMKVFIRSKIMDLNRKKREPPTANPSTNF